MKLPRLVLPFAAGAPLVLGGCLARTALDVVTLPVKATSKAIDLATTSQAEADQKRGRQVRQREEQLGRLQRDYDRLSKKCAQGDREACDRRQRVYGQIQAMLPTVPAETVTRPRDASDR